MKHFLANSNENNRSINSSDFDERLFREYYSYPFYKGVTEGGSRAFMTAYNNYNGIPCTVHPVVKDVTVNDGTEWHHQTDGGAFSQLVTQHSIILTLRPQPRDVSMQARQFSSITTGYRLQQRSGGTRN